MDYRFGGGDENLCSAKKIPLAIENFMEYIALIKMKCIEKLEIK